MKLLRRVRARIRLWKSRRFLREHGFTTWAQYVRATDVDFNPRGNTAKSMYCGYPYIQEFTSTRTPPFIRYSTWQVAYAEMYKWCTENCQDKFRDDILRVYKQTGLTQIGDSVDWLEEPEWFVNEIGGADVMFFAFKNQQDYTWFKLKWL